MSFIPLPAVDTSGSGEIEVRVADNDIRSLMNQMVMLQKIIIKHAEHITDEVYAEEDLDGMSY